ncbi:hypothetical protein ACFS2C_16685 [Prauserella oleivorans]|uniref:Tryptophan-associated transmembrane protein n=1 Tax=Prauserella oleivorans TaxID=1478153 RepID=A0ABW5WBW3_9PSEU
MPTSRPTAAHVSAVVSSLGLVVAVTGSFLPWFRSGEVERNSYQAAGLVDRFALLDNPFATGALAAWGAVPLLCALCVALFATRLLRVGATTTVLLAIVVGTVSLLATVQRSDGEGVIGITPAGPLTTTTGMGIALLGGLGVLGTAWRPRRRGPTPRTQRPHSAPEERTGREP